MTEAIPQSDSGLEPATGAPVAQPVVSAPTPDAALVDQPDPGLMNTFETQGGDGRNQSLFWCPNCHIVRQQSGTCPVCQRDLVSAGGSLPYGPYQPKRMTQGRWIRLLKAGLTLVAIGLPIAAAFWLYGSGAPPLSGPNDGLVHTTAQTSAHVPELGNVNLPGTWVPDPITRDALSANLNANGGKANVLMVARSGNIIIWEASVTQFPLGGASDCKITPTGNGTPTIAGKPAQRSDATVACSDGTSYVREYDMKDTGATLVLKFVASDANAPFDQFENAFLALPGSKAGATTII